MCMYCVFEFSFNLKLLIFSPSEGQDVWNCLAITLAKPIQSTSNLLQVCMVWSK